MMLRPADCDGTDCGPAPSGRWQHMPGCLSLTDGAPEDEGPPPEYADGWRRVPAGRRVPVRGAA